MRWMMLAVLAGCGAAPPPPARTVAAPSPPACVADECAAKLEAEPRYETPSVDWRPPILEPTPVERATCVDVGATLASVALGNYADRAELEPRAAEARARCEQLGLDQATRTCIAGQLTAAGVAYCEQRMLPETVVAIVPAAECDAVLAEITRRYAALPRYHYERIWWEPRAAAFGASCKQDRWTRAYADCVKTGNPSYCMYEAPAPLQPALSAMLAAADAADRAAREQFLAAYAAPAKHPKVKLDLMSAGECARMMAAVHQRHAALPAGHWEPPWWTPRAEAFRASCLKDRWTRLFGECVRAQAASLCVGIAPVPLQQRLQAIMFTQPPAPPPRRKRTR